MSSASEPSKPIWQPSPARIAAANATRFIAAVNSAHGLALRDWHDLERWSRADLAAFWRACATFTGVEADWGTGPVLERPTALPGARWFTGTHLSFAANLLKGPAERPALIAVNESGSRRCLTLGELRSEVTRVAAGLRAAGVVPGDRVAAVLPNGPEAVIALLATASIGAIFSSCSPDFGAAALADRFGQIEPKLLFAVDRYRYGGKLFHILPVIQELQARLPSLTRTIVVSEATLAVGIGGPCAIETFADFGDRSAPLELPRFPFDQPLVILYSSGTTGKPKCIVHGAGGTLLQHLKEHQLHADLRPGDVFFYYTTCGWMMWNWLVSGLASGATLLLYDGAPLHPDTDVLWRLAEREQVAIFGTSARYLQQLEKAGYRRPAPLPALRTLLSTGSPLGPESYDYVYGSLQRDVHLASIAGGTDLIGCFVGGSPLLPVRRGEIQCRGLGMAVAVYDDAGRPVVDRRGELVCTAPFPSVPLGFWNDRDSARFRASYFERFPGVWHHGDDALETPAGGFIIHGRSDAVLNPGGVRIGTAEIYRQVERLPEVLESIAVGQEWHGDTRIVLLVRLAEGVALDDALRDRIRTVLRTNASPRHVPAVILQVADLPRTRSGKLAELIVRDVVNGRSARSTEGLANPESLRLIPGKID